ncbi:Glycosyltransferase involved in cell wall bisynthesis [Micromonospora phaseoli]|uniref:Glycosyltransferase involved in cell wall bisynthesis n=1 Tax=Micromonospora phaseoli TaxID=1144548 RepID=A0A1H7DWE5_9ACTN|nr:glycosyltransferase family 4 protein [Micromonospora phaseoli]PZV89929.1 glycosyltransferase involved in cell wall biosynthesis [Micromonospora phaseoli]GIJ81126.1 glycosyl transferase [Micromonospora phaseoli]SEK05704.1 Glycosyltransferase involved in cell wall bisynthesis [Micromonospora phaseoli]
MSARSEPTAIPERRGTVLLLLASSTGGVGQHVRALARALTVSGEAVLVCGPAATADQFDFAATGARFQPVEIPASPTPADARAVAALRRVLATEQVSVVHAHGLRAGLVAVLTRPAVPLVVTWHNAVLAGGLRGGLSRLAERVVARGAQVTLGASADLVERAAALGAADARLAPVAAPELPAPRRRRAAVRAEFAVAADQPLILSVGRLHPQKRYDVLVDAAARWRERHPPPVVVIAGSGPAYLPLAARVSAARAPVTLLGHRGDVADLLTGADLAVVTSDWEARQLFAQEALRAGVPLVATAVGGLPELVGDGALLVPPGDVDAVDAAVRGLLDDDTGRDELARRGAARAATWPTEAETVAQLVALYAELTTGPTGPSTPDADAPSTGRR